MLRRILLVCSLALLALPAVFGPAVAAWPHDSNVGAIAVSTASGDQASITSVSDGAGGAIVAWRDTRSGTGDIYVQRVHSSGATMWLTNGVLVCGATNNQLSPEIVSDGAGGAIIAWYDLRGGATYDVYAQRVNASGLVLWAANGVAVCTAANQQIYPQVTPDGSNGAIITWYDLRSGANYDIYAQRLNSAGVAQWAANGVGVCTAVSEQSSPRIVSDGAAGAIIAWTDFRNGVDQDIYTQRVNSVGTVQWAANGVAICTALGDQYSCELTPDGANGAIVIWADVRGADEDVYAQRVHASGSVVWSINGVAVSAVANDQSGPHLDSDGSGGAIIAWDDARSGGFGDVYAQRLNTAGTAQWTANGVALCTQAEAQSLSDVLADGAGGAIVSWSDRRGGVSYDIYAQRVSSSGAIQWASNGVGVCTAVANQFTPMLVSDGAAGAIVVWQDQRNITNVDLYCQRVERYGQLGNPEPAITTVSDVKNDQGGSVKLVWNASYLDVDPTYGITEYRVFRSVPGPLLTNGATSPSRATTTDSDEAVREGKLLLVPNGAQVTTWEFVGTQAAEAFPSYSKVVATTADSVDGSNPRTFFMVEARASTSISSDRWSSAPDSGYSVDNLAPAAPAPLTGQYAAGTTQLHWNRNTETDLAGYRLYRGSSASFVPSPSNFVAALPDTGAADAAGAPYVYKLTAVDVHGNESPVATLVPAGTLGVGDGPARTALSFASPSPNPARGSTTLRFSLSHAGPVKLALFDAAGRRVATLADGAMEAGEHSATFALRDDAGHELAAGLYLARLEAEGRVITRRVAAVR